MALLRGRWTWMRASSSVGIASARRAANAGTSTASSVRSPRLSGSCSESVSASESVSVSEFASEPEPEHDVDEEPPLSSPPLTSPQDAAHGEHEYPS